MHKLIFQLFPFYAIIAAVPNPRLMPRDLDINNPSGSDPTTPPKTISFPTAKPENPYPSGIPTQPDQCDGQNPSDDCFNAMGSSDGYLYFDKDNQCTDDEKSALETAVWDATTLASYSSNFPNNGEGTRGQAGGIFYMGPDFASQSSRISGNLKRAWQFKTSSTSEKEYITTSCKDTKNLCGKMISGKAVGGYAWTYSGWLYYYHYITLCPPFFSLDTMSDKINEVEQELAAGNTKWATDMTYLGSTGQFFLHEMMHTRIVDGGVEPHIIDEYFATIPDGEKPGTIDIKAYGPRLVHNLAKRSLSNGGGATRASTNADSYAMLANAAWWWDTTNYFPGVPGKANPATTADDFDDNDFPVSLHVDLDNRTSPTAADFNSLFNDNLQAFADSPPDPDYPSAASTTTPAPAAATTPPPATATTPPAAATTPPPATTTTPPATTTTPPATTTTPPATTTTPPATTTTPPPPPPPPPAADTCGDWYKFLFDHFEIYGKNFDPTKFGTNGDGLKSQISGCGDLTKWSFQTKSDDPNGYQWFATGNLPIGTKACVGRAVMSAGGGSPDGCTGSG